MVHHHPDGNRSSNYATMIHPKHSSTRFLNLTHCAHIFNNKTGRERPVYFSCNANKSCVRGYTSDSDKEIQFKNSYELHSDE